MYKKVRCTCKVVVLPTKPVIVFGVLVAVASWDRKVPTVEATLLDKKMFSFKPRLRSI